MQEDQTTEKIVSPSLTPLEIWDKEKVEVTQHKTIERLTFGKLLKDIANSFNFEKGLLPTIVGLTIRPDKTICSYLDTGRYDFINPVKYFLLIFGLTIFIGSMTDYYILDTSELSNINGIEEKVEVSNNADGDRSVDKSFSFRPMESIEVITFINNAATKYSNFFGLINIFFYSLVSFLFFRSSKFNFVEHLSINAYIITHTSIWFLFLVIIGSTNPALLIIQSLLQVAMIFYVYFNLFEGSEIKVIFKTIGVLLTTAIVSGIVSFLGIGYYLMQSGILEEFYNKRL